MADYTPLCQAAIIKALKADPGYTAIIPKASIYDETVPQTPTWPFSRIGSVTVAPFRATGLASSSLRMNVQAFSKDVIDSTGTVLRPAASNVGFIAAAMIDALDGTTLTLANSLKLRMTWVQRLISMDGDEAAAWKVSVIFTGEVSG